MDAYLSSLIQELNEAMSAETKPHLIKLDVETGMQIATDKAVSVGVMVTELVTNAYKYAYPDNAEGDILVALRTIDRDRLVLSVQDEGIGWREGAKPKGTGVGTRVIKAMAGNLKGTLIYDDRPVGTRVVVEFAA
jgi:two-component sensor histidine kinase